ncbi:peroxiredoxin [Dyadobacter sp. 3J3]|uniref:peroxiredoxin family protein n=1 Tax=Dyadobacter sp. 3J3 TaxID=2606600 RepID=UPI0013592E0F|nr:TlpA disulfide reductase family protein [Dyadobacter sp. 3J3]
MKKIISALCLFFVLSSGFCLGQKSASSMVAITVRFTESGPGDSLFLSFQDELLSFGDITEQKLVRQLVDQNGNCSFHIPVKTPKGRFVIYKYYDVNTQQDSTGNGKILAPLTPDFFWHPADKLRIEITRNKNSIKSNHTTSYDFHYQVSGHGALKNIVKCKVDSAYNYGPYHSERTFSMFDQDFNYQDASQDMQKAAELTLESYKTKIGKLYYNVIKSDAVFAASSSRFSLMKQFFEQKVKNDPKLLQKFLTNYDRSLNAHFLPAVDSNSIAGLRYLYRKAVFDDYVHHGEVDADRLIHKIYKNYQGAYQDRLVSFALSETAPANFNSLLDSALTVVKDPASLMLLKKLSARRSGQTPFAFSLPDASGNYIKLEDLKGKVVFVDFWFTGCGGCTDYFSKVLSKAEEHFEGKDIVFVTISGDLGKPLWLRSVKSGTYVSDKSVNLFTEGKGFKHPAISHYNFESYPSLLLIDRNGKIQEFNTQALLKRDPDHLIRVLQNAIDK